MWKNGVGDEDCGGECGRVAKDCRIVGEVEYNEEQGGVFVGFVTFFQLAAMFLVW